MSGSLFDTSVWIAALFEAHPFHNVAQQALVSATALQPAVFCRATEQSFLRLITTPALQKIYGADGLSNAEAILALETLQALPQVCVRGESPELTNIWFQLATRNSASPKVWMDAYLAAFAISGSLQLLTLDRDFKNFLPNGLALTLLNPETRTIPR